MRAEQSAETTRQRFAGDVTIRASNCIAADELGALRDGRLAEPRREAVAEHLAGCAACREFFARIGRRIDDPERIGRYLVRGRLGAGGMGVVYEAVDPDLDRRVAIKVVRPEQLDDTARRRLLREARALAKISHPNVVTVHDVGEHGRQVFVATELVDGETMATWQVGRSERALIEAWIQVARGLSAAHAGGLVHRDVKPSNVLVGRDGRVRIGDFGIASSRGGNAAPSSAAPIVELAGVTVTGAVAGTPGYMAPEQLRGEVDARSDQYGLCVSIVEGITGRRPGRGPLPPLPAAVRQVVVRGLSAEPAARFATMAELADALGAVLQPPTQRAGSKRGVVIAIGGAIAAFAALAVIVAVNVPAAQPARPASAPDDAREHAAGDRGRVVESVAPPAPVSPVIPEPAAPPAAPEPPRSLVLSASRIAELERAPRVVASLVQEARALLAAGKWVEARAPFELLENLKAYRAEALYSEAWAAFQTTDAARAQQLAIRAAAEDGPYKTRATFLYGDALFLQGEYARAKAIYQELRAKQAGELRTTARKKIVVCNRNLGLPDADGITD